MTNFRLNGGEVRTRMKRLRTTNTVNMGPKKAATELSVANNALITAYRANNDAETPPAWAKQLEENIVGRLQETINFQDGRITELHKTTQEGFKRFDERMEDFEFHTRKFNLLFFGLNYEGNNECEAAIRKFIREDLEIGDRGDRMLFAHCHPLPRSAPNVSASIVRFVQFCDRDLIMKSLSKLRGKGSKVSVRTDLPKKLRERRNALQKELARIRREEKNRTVRLLERGQEIRLEEKKHGNWNKIDMI
jgi:hypothetical protein